MLELENKVVMVTGAGGAIGRQMCKQFAEAGADIAVLDISEENAKQTAAVVEEIGRKAFVGICDIRDSKRIREIVEEVEQKLGVVDVLVNNAGGAAGMIGKLSRFVDAEEETLRYIVELNLFGTMYCTKAVLPGMIRKKYGKIINIASISGVCGIVDRVDYSAAKGGIISMTKALAMEVGEFNICVNAISPGNIMRDGVVRYGGTFIGPKGRTGEPKDVANMAVYLASAKADYITGQNYCVDGGRCLGPK
jgi:NAD(P)-dependent dehydrogenase (short-subunit alcohol dehydrogenase family)